MADILFINSSPNPNGNTARLAIMQGAAPERWMLEACEYTMSRFSKICGFEYKGMITNTAEAKEKNWR